MSAVVGIDLSTKALDLVKLNESDNRAEWVRCELAGKDAWERTLRVRDALPRSTAYSTQVMFGRTLHSQGVAEASWWDDVYLVAIETPFPDQQGVLRRVQGAVLASLPVKLRQSHTCWEANASEWKAALGLKGKPGFWDLVRLAGGDVNSDGVAEITWADQNARDAYCIAMWARDTNARAVAAA